MRQTIDVELVEGLRKLKTGAMVNLISVVLVLISVVVLFSSVGMVNPENPQAFLIAVSAMGSFIALMVVAVILGIVGFVMYFIVTGHIKRYDSKLGIGRWGMLLQVIGLILIFIPLLLLIAIASSRPDATVARAIFASFGLLFVGGLLIIVGQKRIMLHS